MLYVCTDKLEPISGGRSVSNTKEEMVGPVGLEPATNRL